MTHFWRSESGEFIRAHRRRMVTLHVTIPAEAPTKKSRRGTRQKAASVLRDAFASDALAAVARDRTNWPKPRAAIALDIWVTSRALNGAR